MATAMPNNGVGLSRAGDKDLGTQNPDMPGTSSGGIKGSGALAAVGVMASTAGGSVSDKERKIGHRRVNDIGEVTYKKVSTNHLMGSIQLGIGHAIGALNKYDERDLLMQDFMTVETTSFPKNGSNQTPAHTFTEYTFKTYAPLAFRYFLNLFGIQRDDFLVSLCSQPMRELSNPGASGSIFYLTYDDEFILKTVMAKEADFLQKLLPGYYMNLNQNPHTLLPKFFGMYMYQCNQKNIRVIIMNNLLPSNIKMHLKFDLKGSTFKRKANKHERAKNSPTYKDLDFVDLLPEGLMLEAETYNALISTMRRDCRVLESFRIMDYSLLIGIHNLDMAAKEAAESSGGVSPTKEQARREAERKLQKYNNRQKLVTHSTPMESIQAQTEPIDEQDHLPPGGIPARNHKGERLLLYLGIIDILQSYRMRKKLEHTFKAIIHDGDTVSVHRPGFYAHRFLDFMADKVFRKIPSLDLPEITGTHRKFRSIVSSIIALKHSPSKRGKRDSIKKSSNANDKDGAGNTTATGACALTSEAGAGSTSGPGPSSVPFGGASNELGQLRGAAAISGFAKATNMSSPTRASPTAMFHPPVGAAASVPVEVGATSSPPLPLPVASTTSGGAASTATASATGVRFPDDPAAPLSSSPPGVLTATMSQPPFATSSFDEAEPVAGGPDAGGKGAPGTLNIPAVLWDRPTGSSKRVPPPIPPRSPKRPIDQMASFAAASAASSSAEVTRGASQRPDVVPGDSTTSIDEDDHDHSHSREVVGEAVGIGSSSDHHGSSRKHHSSSSSRPKHKRQDQVQKSEVNHSSLGDLHSDYETITTVHAYGTPSHLSVGTAASWTTPTWTEGTPSYTASTASSLGTGGGGGGRTSAGPGNTPSRNIVDDVSSGASYSNSTMTSSSKHTQYYNYPQSGGGGGGSHSTAYSSSASSSTATTASSFYTQTTTSKSISNRHEEKRLETCSYQETEM